MSSASAAGINQRRESSPNKNKSAWRECHHPKLSASVMTKTCTPNCKAADIHNNAARTETCERDGLPLLRSARAPIKQAQRDNKQQKSAEHKRRRSQSRATFPLTSVRGNQNLHVRKMRLQRNLNHDTSMATCKHRNSLSTVTSEQQQP